MTTSWNVASAKARFSQLLDKACSDGPQTVTRNGRRMAVVVSVEEWERRTKPKLPLGRFLAESPLRGSGLETARDPSGPRDLDL